MKKIVILEEERVNTSKEIIRDAKPVIGFSLKFLSRDESQIIRKVEVRDINFQDIKSYLERGEIVLISPKFLENSSTNTRKHKEAPWYFTHM